MMLRDARPTDATAIARVHVRAWQAAYRGLLPDGYLDALRAEDRLARFPLGTQDPRAARTIVALLDGSIAGFVSLGPSRDDDAPQAGEVYALYVEPSRWDRGVGRTLMRAANARLRAAGFDEALLWVLVGNRRAERFYESEGWRVDGARRSEDPWGVAADVRRFRLGLA